LLINGQEYKQDLPGVGKYHCLAGPLEIARYTYRPVGEHNGKTVGPLELVAGLAEGDTPALAYNIMQGYAERDMRQHAESLLASHLSPPPRAKLERMAKRLAQEATKAASKIEVVLRQMEVLPEGARAMLLGLDRTTVPMAEPRPEEATAEPRKKRRKPRKRRAPKPIDVVYRMAYVGTVTIVDEHGEKLVTRRYALPASDDPSTIAKRIMADVRAAVRRDPG
jgi:hypothetical protein